MTAVARSLLGRRDAFSPRARRVLLLVSAAAVTAAAVWAWRRSGLGPGDLHPAALVVAVLVAAPLSLALRAAEFDLAARLVGRPVAPRRALDVALVASAANLLPVPGSLLVTWRALSDDGTGAGRALGAGAVPGLSWLALTGMVGGTAMIVAGAAPLGVATLTGGVVATLVATRLVVSLVPARRRLRLVARLVAVELGWLGASVLRLSLALSALDHPVELPRVLALSVAGSLTVAVGVFPAGLGLREALIAGVGAAVGLGLDVAVLVGTVDRLVWLVFLAAALGVASLRPR
ncbi:MAG: hypothetical protein D6683_13290, partial [Actinomyces sp.]